MSITTHADWEGLQSVGHVARVTLDVLETAVQPGITTGELDDIAARLIAAHGARSAPAVEYGFPGTVLISINDEIVHGIPGRRRIQEGDLVKLDVTLEKDGYVADAARSVIAGRGTDEAARLVAAPNLRLPQDSTSRVRARASARSVASSSARCAARALP